ncbi:DinB family protein [Alkalicoccus luteus]|uniref:Damage-inducible protein DinB n=1 Tax=Alkalicoccus luteus TaxID=1237094 RepID=A0A969TTU2_9BACI|nr:DinB family protein [Alkalicoccus luteus]NJP38018.1 hypothetical protein [Alkalicoccus luteus]
MTKSTSFLKKYFLSHREVTKELTEKIASEDYAYKPTDTSMTAEELVTHMLTSFHQFACIAAGEEPEKLHEDTEQATLQELAERYTDASVKKIESISDERLEETIDLSETFGMKVPAWRLIEIGIDHEINHKGNLFVYVRSLGFNELPMFVKA